MEIFACALSDCVQHRFGYHAVDIAQRPRTGLRELIACMIDNGPVCNVGFSGELEPNIFSQHVILGVLTKSCIRSLSLLCFVHGALRPVFHIKLHNRARR